MSKIVEKQVLTTIDVLKIEKVSHRTLMRHLKKLTKGALLYDKYRTYKAGRQWRFEIKVAA
ncbi:MAG: hypothetical protein AAFZ15_32420 [Bacteroidota bacterium]